MERCHRCLVLCLVALVLSLLALKVRRVAQRAENGPATVFSLPTMSVEEASKHRQVLLAIAHAGMALRIAVHSGSHNTQSRLSVITHCEGSDDGGCAHMVRRSGMIADVRSLLTRMPHADVVLSWRDIRHADVAYGDMRTGTHPQIPTVSSAIAFGELAAMGASHFAFVEEASGGLGVGACEDARIGRACAHRCVQLPYATAVHLGAHLLSSPTAKLAHAASSNASRPTPSHPSQDALAQDGVHLSSQDGHSELTRALDAFVGAATDDPSSTMSHDMSTRPVLLTYIGSATHLWRATLVSQLTSASSARLLQLRHEWRAQGQMQAAGAHPISARTDASASRGISGRAQHLHSATAAAAVTGTGTGPTTPPSPERSWSYSLPPSATSIPFVHVNVSELAIRTQAHALQQAQRAGTSAGGIKDAAADLLQLELHAALRRSRFCLMPLGNTFVRALFYDALLRGCIPVIFRVQAQVYNELLGKHLPIGRLCVLINADPWDQRIGELALPEGFSTLGTALLHVLERIPDAQLASYRRAIRKLWQFLQFSSPHLHGEPDAMSVALGLVYKISAERHLTGRSEVNMQADRLLFGRSKGADGQSSRLPTTRAESDRLPFGTCQRECKPSNLGLVQLFPVLEKWMPMHWLATSYFSLLGHVCFHNGKGYSPWREWRPVGLV
jgi:hypothetical protein